MLARLSTHPAGVPRDPLVAGVRFSAGPFRELWQGSETTKPPQWVACGYWWPALISGLHPSVRRCSSVFRSGMHRSLDCASACAFHQILVAVLRLSVSLVARSPGDVHRRFRGEGASATCDPVRDYASKCLVRAIPLFAIKAIRASTASASVA